MWIVLALASVITSGAHSYFLWPFSASKVCLENELHPLIRLAWNEKQFNLYKVATGPRTAETYFLHSKHLAYSSMSVGASFRNGQTARFELKQDGVTLSLPLNVNLWDIFSFEYLYQTTNQNDTFRFQKLEAIEEDNEAWVFEFTFLRNSFSKLAGTLTIMCEKIVLNGDCKVVVMTTFPRNNIIWEFVFSQRSQRHGGEVLLKSLENSPINIFLSCNWKESEVGYNAQLSLTHGLQEIVEVNGNYTIQQSKLEVSFSAVSKVLNLKSTVNFEKYRNENGPLTRLLAKLNFIHQPSAYPMVYQFGLQEGSNEKLLDLRHNVSSPLYRFEGNMTIEKESTNGEPSIITRIWQKVRSPISDLFKLDLEQIVNQTGTWSWETTLMHSGFMDMHVSALWNGSILDYYSKKFQFKSQNENLVPSLNILLSYVDRMHFHHRLEFPFQASAFELLIKRSSDSLLPIDVQILFEDGFKRNFSVPIASLSVVNRKEYVDVQFSSKPRFQQAFEGLVDLAEKIFGFMSDQNNTINKILKLVLPERVVDWVHKSVDKIVQFFQTSLNL